MRRLARSGGPRTRGPARDVRPSTTDYTTIVAVAFLAQLAVLPGEKGQFTVAALSTRYHPLGVAAAASAAFAGWTALEIRFGSALRTVLPAVALDAITAVLFLAFAVLLVRSAPNPGQDVSTVPDGGLGDIEELRLPVLDREVPDALGGYLPIFALLAAGEVGDKTQLVTIGLAARYGATSALWIGEMAAIIPVSLLQAYVFHRFAHLVEAGASTWAPPRSSRSSGWTPCWRYSPGSRSGRPPSMRPPTSCSRSDSPVRFYGRGDRIHACRHTSRSSGRTGARASRPPSGSPGPRTSS